MGAMDEIPTRPQHLFIVRLWSDDPSPSRTRWRGSVEHVASKQKIYFTSLGDLQDFIALHLVAWAQTQPTPKK